MTMARMVISNRKGLNKLISSGSPQQWWLQWTNWKPLWSRGRVITSQVLNAEHRADPKIMGNIEFVSAWTKSLQNLVWTPALSMKPFQSSQWEPPWVHSDQHIVTYNGVLQSLVRLCSRLILINANGHSPCIMHMQLMQMWCRWLNCGDGWDTSGKREKAEEIPRPRCRPINRRLKRKVS